MEFLPVHLNDASEDEDEGAQYWKSKYWEVEAELVKLKARNDKLEEALTEVNDFFWKKDDHAEPEEERKEARSFLAKVSDLIEERRRGG